MGIILGPDPYGYGPLFGNMNFHFYCGRDYSKSGWHAASGK